MDADMNNYQNAEDAVNGRYSSYERELAIAALQAVPERCVVSVGELAHRIGVDKLLLIRWFREDVAFARVIESKIARSLV
jgi:hypothetical protein